MQSFATARRIRNHLILGAILCASWFSPQAAAALVDLELLVTPSGGLFQYSATVRNNSLVDLSLVSIVDAPIAEPLIGTSVTAPAGFLALYDSGLGIIDFVEGVSVFGAGATVSGFSFTSATLADTMFFTQFEAIDVNGVTFLGTITTQVGPGGPAVPDSASTVTLASFAIAFLALARRLSRSREMQGETI